MDNPLVCAIMLTKDRPAMAARAVRSFREQTYQNKRLAVLDTSMTRPMLPSSEFRLWTSQMMEGRTIGYLRNAALWWQDSQPDRPAIYIHWDDDDWSHPNRIAEQVALLQDSKKQCVGYNHMLFWRTPRYVSKAVDVSTHSGGSMFIESGYVAEGEAWLYRHPSPNYCLGTSLCYWRECWEQHPFPDLPKNNAGTGEDTEWLQGVESVGISSLECSFCDGGRGNILPRCHRCGLEYDPNRPTPVRVPRMIASIHGKNTMHYATVLEESTSWKRVPEWDEYCARTMAL